MWVSSAYIPTYSEKSINPFKYAIEKLELFIY